MLRIVCRLAVALSWITGLAVGLGDGRGEPGKLDPKLPRIPPRTPQESLKAFVPWPGFRVELAAAEPLVQSPVACDWDENGRLYVAEAPEYNAYAGTRPHGHGRIVCLEDTDDDGVFDKRTVLVDQVRYPTGIHCWNGGVYVGAAPDLLFFKDTDGDGKADIRRVVLTGFGTDPAGEGQLNSFRWTLENRILISTGLDGGELKAKDGSAVSLRNMNVLLDPRDDSWELTSGGGQHGMSLDDFGRVFVSGNSDPILTLAYDARYLSGSKTIHAPPAAVNILPSGKFTRLNRISEVEPWRALRTQLRKEGKIPGSDEGGTPAGFFTGATGVTVYRGDAFPEEFRGNVFVGEVANNLIFRALLKPNGSLPVAEPADPKREFLASRDVWFRPVQLANAPDGCLYVLDMYRELIEGAAFLAPQVLKNVDPSAGVDQGRIWRIVPEGWKRRPRPALGSASAEQLVDLLDHPNGWHRDTAARLLAQRRPLGPAIRQRLEQLARRGRTPQGRIHALYALAPFRADQNDLLRDALKDPEPRVREHALRLSEQPPSENPTPRKGLSAIDVWELRRDPDPNVRIQLAYSLRRIRAQGNPATQVRGEAAVFVQLALRDSADPWMRQAILAGLGPDHVLPVFSELAVSRFLRDKPEGKAFILSLGELAAADESGDAGPVLLSVISQLAGQAPSVARGLMSVTRQRGSVATLTIIDDPNWAATVKNLQERLFKDAVMTARDMSKPIPVRSDAIRDLVQSPFRDVAPVLKETLAARQPPEIQSVTLEVLGRFGDDAVPPMILDAWPAMTPAVRATATEVLLSRNNWVMAFLDAVEARTIARGDVDPARVALLKKSPVRAIGIRASRLFAAPADRQKVVDQYRQALTIPGDPERGKVVFRNHCASCHKLEGVGEEVGEDLQAVRNRGMESVLVNILDPNREVKPRFLTYAVELKTMRVVTGLLAAESATSVTIRRADGRSETIARSDIDSLRSLGTSFMPEGLENQIDIPAMADLLAYLNSIK